MKRKKVVITFAYLQNNLGDDLFVQHLCLRYPYIDFYVIEKNLKNETLEALDNLYFSKKMKKYFKEYDKPIMSTKAQKFYKQFDACLMIGGSIFMQHDDNWNGKINNFKNRMAINSNSYILGANFGPFNDARFLSSFASVFKNVKDICFRDSFSASYFPDSNKIRYAPDILFSYKYKQLPQENKVAISLINGYFTGRPVTQVEKLQNSHEDYVNKMVEICSELYRKGITISLLSFCKYQGDLRVAEIIESKCLQNGITNIKICSYEGDITPILNEIASSKAVIATRFHAMILGFLFGKSVYPIIYDEKQKYVLQDLNFYGDTCTIENIEKLDAKHVVDCLLDPQSKNSYESIKPAVEKAIVEAEKQFAGLDKILKGDVE